MRSVLALAADHRARFGRSPRVFQAPGRVNLIGEHTDYNDGFVLPMAIDLVARVAASLREDRRVQVYARNQDDLLVFDLDAPPPQPRGLWLDYVEGVARVLEEDGTKLRGLDLSVEGDVPLGAGLSSSAALELAAGLAFVGSAGAALSREQLARVGQRAEHRYVGTRCGIMDQLVSARGEAAHALLIDCRSLEASPVSLALEETAIVVCDTRVKHALATSEYNSRRSACEEAVARLRTVHPGIRALRDVTMPQLQASAGLLSPEIFRRARHVVTENSRTLEAAEAFARGDWRSAGLLMQASHASLRDDYEVTVAALDIAVEAALRQPGVYGSRMTGGGFGGSTVTLVERAAVGALGEALKVAFRDNGLEEPGVREVRPSAGAHELTLD